MEWEKSGQPPVPLRHHVLLIGAKDPRLFFNIAIDPECEGKLSNRTQQRIERLVLGSEENVCLPYKLFAPTQKP